MADRRDYFFRQKVTEAELDAGFEGLEQADRALSVDHELIGIVLGMGVSQKAGTPDLSVDVQGPGTAYSKQGERIGFSSTQNVDVSQDDGASSTAVAVGGNEKWISVFIEFDRALSDPRIDGNSVTVFHVRDESFSFSVVQGAEASIGTATRPALDPNKILLADVRRTFGQTQILNADISTTRREDAFKYTGGTVEIIQGTAHDAIGSLLTAFNNHLDGAANQHPASEITYGGSGNWATGSGIAAGTIEAALDQVVSDLATVAATSGADRVGIKARSNWLGGRTNPATNVFAAIEKIINDLAATNASDDGAERIGFNASGNIAATDVGAAIRELDTEKVAKAGDSMTGSLSLGGGADFLYSPGRSRTIAVPLSAARVKDGSGWIPDTVNQGEWITDGATFDERIFFDLLPFLPDGATFASVSVVWEQTAGFGSVSDQMAARLRRHQFNYTTLARTVSDPVGFGAAYGTGTGIKINNALNPSNFTIDKLTGTLADTALLLEIESAVGGVSRLLAVRMTFTDPGPRNI